MIVLAGGAGSPRPWWSKWSGSVAAAVATVWLVFKVTGISGALGFAICALAAFFLIFGLLSWRLHGLLVMKDRLATNAIWIGACSRSSRWWR